MRALLAISNVIEIVLRLIAQATGWLMVVLTLVICFDILTRKIGFQLPDFGSTRLQELEWHLHTVIFSGWLGFNYYLNAHPRVDSLTQPLSHKTKAWMELVGCLIFALPYSYICAKFGIDFVRQSYMTHEGSTAGPIGLPETWIIKAFFVAGLFLLLAAVIGVTLRLIVFHFGGELAKESKLPIDEAPEIL